MEAMLTPTGERAVVACLYWVDYSNPDLPFFNEQTHGILHSLIAISYSNDNGETWTKPAIIDLPGINDVVEPALTGPILLLKNKKWACQFEINKPYNAAYPWRHSAILMFSTNYGKSWDKEYSVAANDPENNIFYWDQRPSIFSDGTIFNLFWTYNNKTNTYENIHARKSSDHGKTWSPIWNTGIPGQPGQAIKLPDGRIIITYIDRTDSPAIKQRISYDDGQTFTSNTEATLYEKGIKNQNLKKKTMKDAWNEMSKFSMGHPFATLLPDNDILVSFYAGENQDTTSIYWMRIRY